MACLPISPFTLSNDCAPRMGGIDKLIWGPAIRVTLDETMFSPFDENGCYIALVLAEGYFHEIEGRGSFQSIAQVNDDTGLTHWRDELSFQPAFPDMGDVTLLLAALSAAGDDGLVVIASGPVGQYVLGLAFTNTYGNAGAAPVWLSAGSIQTGTEHADFNGGQFTLASVHPLPAAVCQIVQ